eukprot:gene10668-3291_t
MSNQGIQSPSLTPRQARSPPQSPRKSEEIQIIEGNKVEGTFPFNTIIEPYLVANTEFNLGFKKKMETPKREESESDDDEIPWGVKQNLYNDILQEPNKYNEEQSQKELKQIMKKAGLLDTPANMLEIGSAHYYNKKKIDNLTNLIGQQKLKKIKIDSIKEEVEEAWKDAYDRFKQHSEDNDLSLPEDKIRKGAQLMMQSKMNEKMEEINLLFPYLN